MIHASAPKSVRERGYEKRVLGERARLELKLRPSYVLEPHHERPNIEGQVTALRDALKTDDLSRIKKLSEELQQAFYAISQQLYQQGQPQGGMPGSDVPGGNGHGPSAGPQQPPSDEGVVDGQFREA